ncbi:MAG: GntR family transcriptional regulator [Propionibacteriaceae bacterium]|nr:GntR family transcriptional regulator [Propionibacteriaceae bacterium]
MEFDTSSPIWLQLVTEFSRRVATAEWAAGQRIPGVRELALQLAVNPNTVQRALTEMERDGLCRSERTSGRFVTEDSRRISRLRRELAAGAADDYVRISRGLSMELQDAMALVDERWNENDNPDQDQARAGG